MSAVRRSRGVGVRSMGVAGRSIGPPMNRSIIGPKQGDQSTEARDSRQAVIIYILKRKRCGQR